MDKILFFGDTLWDKPGTKMIKDCEKISVKRENTRLQNRHLTPFISDIYMCE